MYRHILVASDGSATADKAVAAGVEYAREAHARVTLFAAVPHERGESEMLMRGAVSGEELERRTGSQAEDVLASCDIPTLVLR